MRLSICIPTYNRCDLLRETLESVLVQDREGLEIVVCDNASMDGTQALVEEYSTRFRKLTYFRWPENMGFDRNVLKVVEVAHGEYCWLMGDDDHLEPTALDRLFPMLEGNYGLIYLNAMTYDAAMQNPSGPTLKRFDCSDAGQTLLSLASWITFVSSICVRRAGFMSYLDAGYGHVGTGFAHCYPVLNVLMEGHNLIVEEPALRFRAGNTGNYNIFNTFIGEFNNILAYCLKIGFSEQVIAQLRKQNVYLVLVPALVQIKRGKLKLKADDVLKHLAGSGLCLKEKVVLIGMAWFPAWLFRCVAALRRAVSCP